MAKRIHPKLKTSQPNDVCEREAERVSERVMRASPVADDDNSGEDAPDVARFPTFASPRRQSSCRGCTEKLQCYGGRTAETIDDNTERNIRSPSSGRPLPRSSRSFFEPRFGRSFDNVRIRTDSTADETARALGARAFTRGNEIYFRRGEYQPETKRGRKLLAHELTHVLQQGTAAHRENGGSSTAVRRQSPRGTVQRSTTDIQQVGEELHSADDSTVSCPLVSSTPNATSVLSVRFGIGEPRDGLELTPSQQAEIDSFVSFWEWRGGSEQIRVDGYASVEPFRTDSEAKNLQLSCRRAVAVAEALKRRVPAEFVEFYAYGETDVFGAPEHNRVATVSIFESVPETPPPEPEPPEIVPREEWGARAPITDDPERSYEEYGTDLSRVLDSIVVHHAGNKGYKTIREVQNEHIDDQNRADIGYHYGIDLEGKIYQGRPIDVKGSHVAGANTGKIGIVLLADLDTQNEGLGPLEQLLETEDDTLTSAMEASLLSLVNYLKAAYPGIKHLGGHKEYDTRRYCPGDLVMNEIDGWRTQTGLESPR